MLSQNEQKIQKVRKQYQSLSQSQISHIQFLRMDSKMDKYKYLDDCDLEAMLQGLLKKDPIFKCPSGRPITKLCVNQKCVKSLKCQDIKCSSCGLQVHQLCPSIPLQGVTALLNQRVNKCRQFLQKTFDIGNEFIHDLQFSRRELVNKNSMGNLETRYQRIIKELYQKKDLPVLTGKDAKELNQRLQQQDIHNTKRGQHLLEGYRATMKKLTDQISSMREGVYQEFIQQKELSSYILKGEDDKVKDQIAFLKQSLNFPKKFELMYRGSDYHFSAAEFHKKCDGVPDTLTLIRTEYGKIIGAYTHYEWKSGQGHWVDDVGQKAFILSLDLKQKMVPTDGKHLMYCSSECGPAFGYGCDLKIADKCQQNKESYAEFPTTYNLEGKNKYTAGQGSYRILSGSTDGRNFRVTEYEVFKVIFK